MTKLRRTISPALMPPRPMEIGKIKIGGKGKEITTKKGVKMRLPVKYDHFQVTHRDRGGDDNFVRDEPVHSTVGDEPTHLDIRLMFDSVEENFQSSLLVYRGQHKVFECDGEQAVNLATGETGPCVRAAGGQCPCKPFGRLAVILEAAPHYGGFYLFRTTSWESVNNLQTTLSLLQAQFGSLRGLPLRLVLYPATHVIENGGTSTSQKVGVVLRADYETARTVALEFHRADRIERQELHRLALGVGSTIQETEADDADEPDSNGHELIQPPPGEAEPEETAPEAEQPISDPDFGEDFGIELPNWDKDPNIPANEGQDPKEASWTSLPAPEPEEETGPDPLLEAMDTYQATWQLAWAEGLAGAPPLSSWMDDEDELKAFRADWEVIVLEPKDPAALTEQELRKATAMLRDGIGLDPTEAEEVPGNQGALPI